MTFPFFRSLSLSLVSECAAKERGRKADFPFLSYFPFFSFAFVVSPASAVFLLRPRHT